MNLCILLNKYKMLLVANALNLSFPTKCSKYLQDEMLFFYLMFCIYAHLYIFYVFYGGPHGRIADRLNVFTL